MKNLFFVPIVALLIALTSCSKPAESILNLQDAATSEANASAKYAAFAHRAATDSLPNIAAMFRATSASEAIHRDNHIAVLKKLGVKFTPSVQPIIVDSTLANLYTAKNGEEYEVQSMYPEFIASAENEKARSAIKTFDRAMQAEVKHAQFFIAAIEALQLTNKDDTILSAWAVCPKCGDTYMQGTQSDDCDICGVSTKKFILF